MNPRIPHRNSRKSAKKRMLIIVNPYATTVSDRLKNLVVYALQGRFEVETAETEAQNHATEIGREARDHGYDAVVAFGGDGTLNEVANGMGGTDVPVSVLPGGSTNVVLPDVRNPQQRDRRDRAPSRPGRRLAAP
jgi:diacylglycerol kinase family enzyme